MIFADKLMDLRKKNGWSQEELAEKLNVSRQAVSKWESAQSVPDMSRIIQLSELFGVSTDYLLKDELEQAEVSGETTAADSLTRTVDMEEASAFLKTKEENSRRVALGVLLCILSPVALILLGGAQAAGMLNWSENVAGGIGLVILMLMIVPAVGLFVISNLRISRYEYLEKEPIETQYGVTGMVKDRKEKFQPTHTRYLMIGIMLCVASTIPLFISLMFGEKGTFLQVVGIACILLLAAFGVMLIVRVSILWGGFQMLLEEGDYSRENKECSRSIGFIAGAYWCLITAAYLAWSFIGNSWEISWIIWPIAGVAFGAVMGIMKALRKQ